RHREWPRLHHLVHLQGRDCLHLAAGLTRGAPRRAHPRAQRRPRLRFAMASFLRPAAWLLIAAAIVAPIAMGMNTYYLHVLNLAWIFAIAALGLSVATGVAGQIVLGQAALVGV